MRLPPPGSTEGAEVYEQARPTYPPEAVAWLVEHLRIGPGARVADVAAGTGKLTRLLTPQGGALVGIEPVAGMRSTFVAMCPGVPLVAATAEQLPLAGSALDAITVAQAFHWFDAPAALGEFARCCAPEAGSG